ncbi:LysR substrate-binding domain-containing protein [Pseudomonas sp. NPDC090202]|uniref:LysR substrate-binding domain-containing protein n=1 Tax=unclassified Pseudomonas TaxID=196821 RepID=UPI003805FC41
MIGFSFRQLEYFVAVAEHGSISAAARARHVSQPSVSIAISQLEETLNDRLFRRQVSRGLELTPAGTRLLSQARDILSMAAAMSVQADSQPQVLRGNLSLICFQDLGPYYAPRLLSGFRKAHPEVEVTLFETDLAGVHRSISAGKAELALTYDLGLDSQLPRQVLAELRPYALLSTDHRLASRDAVSLHDLARECLILEDIAQTREYFLSLFWAHDLQPRSQQYTQTFEMQRGLVAHGYGVALSCTRPAGDHCYDGTALTCLPVIEDVAPQRVVLAQSRAMHPSPVAEAFVSWVAQAWQ